MTRDEIMNMPAGGEMDALIWMVLHGQEPNILMCRWVDGEYQPNAGYPTGHISPECYSTDIAAAWEVWDSLVEMGRFPTLHEGLDENGGEETYIYVDLVNPADVSVFADTAPLAICRAALLAVLDGGK